MATLDGLTPGETRILRGALWTYVLMLQREIGRIADINPHAVSMIRDGKARILDAMNLYARVRNVQKGEEGEE